MAIEAIQGQVEVGEPEGKVVVQFGDVMRMDFPDLDPTIIEIGERLLDYLLWESGGVDGESPRLIGRGSWVLRPWVGTPEGYWNLAEPGELGPCEIDINICRSLAGLTSLKEWVDEENGGLRERGFRLRTEQCPLADWNGDKDARTFYRVIVERGGDYAYAFAFEFGEAVNGESERFDGRHSRWMTTYDLLTAELQKIQGIWYLVYDKKLCEQIAGHDPHLLEANMPSAPLVQQFLARSRWTYQMLFWGKTPLINILGGQMPDYQIGFVAEGEELARVIGRQEELVRASMLGIEYNPLAWLLVAYRGGILPWTRLGADLFAENHTKYKSLAEAMVELMWGDLGDSWEDVMWGVMSMPVSETAGELRNRKIEDWGVSIMLRALQKVGLNQYRTSDDLREGLDVVDWIASLPRVNK